MSLYQLQKLIYDVNRNPERRDAYRADKAGFLARYELTPEEHTAITDLDVRSARLRYCTVSRTKITPGHWPDWSKPCRSYLPALRVMLPE
jgi:hypothetical protein